MGIGDNGRKPPFLRMTASMIWKTLFWGAKSKKSEIYQCAIKGSGD
jgi:hypothetical protein